MASEREYNRQIFDIGNDDGREKFSNFLLTLLDTDSDGQGNNEIRIHRDGNPEETDSVVVDWTPCHHCDNIDGRTKGPGFAYLSFGDRVYRQLTYPDGSVELVDPGTEKEKYNEWLSEHEDWEWDEDEGSWVNVNECRRLQIDGMVNGWMDNEPTFTVKEFSMKEGFDMQTSCDIFVNSVVECARQDRVIHRTGYIVVGPKNVQWLAMCSMFYPDKEWTNGSLGRVGFLELRLDRQKFDPDAPTEYYPDRIYVYYSDDVKDRLLFLTDSGYLIASMKTVRKYKRRDVEGAQ